MGFSKLNFSPIFYTIVGSVIYTIDVRILRNEDTFLIFRTDSFSVVSANYEKSNGDRIEF